MGRYSERRGCGREDGGGQIKPREDVLRLEWLNDQWRAGVLPDSGSDAGHRVRAAARGSGSHSHHLSRSDARLRRAAGETLTRCFRLCEAAADRALALAEAGAVRYEHTWLVAILIVMLT